MQKSAHQEVICNHFTGTSNNIVVNAVAGSGKTTTLLMLLELARGHSLFLAFNKSIVDELKKRVRRSDLVNISTFHSLGFRSLNSHYSHRIRTSQYKTWNLLEKVNSEVWRLKKKEFVKTAYHLSDLWDLYRVTLSSTLEQLVTECNRVSVYYDNAILEKFFEFLPWIETYNKSPREIDFTDMVYLCAIHNVTLPTPDTLFIDEAQDLNAAQHRLVDKMRVKGRFVAVGDRLQAIYAFTGSHSESFDIFTQKENTVLLPLSVSYRCPLNVVKFAQRYNQDILPYEGNSPGVVRNGVYNECIEGDMVICRNLKPLVDLFFDLIDLGKRCFIKGKDLGKSLISTIERFSYVNHTHLLPIEFNKELLEIERKLREEGVEEPVKHFKYRTMLERFLILRRISIKFKLVSEMSSFISTIFSDVSKENSIVLSTIHKAKGLENDRVFFLGRNLIPSRYAVTKEQLQQEQNLNYVAVTRARKELIFLKNHIDEDEEFLGSEERQLERIRITRQDNTPIESTNKTAAKSPSRLQYNAGNSEGNRRNLRWY